MNFKKRKYMTKKKKSERNNISDSKIHQLNKLGEGAGGGRGKTSQSLVSPEKQAVVTDKLKCYFPEAWFPLLPFPPSLHVCPLQAVNSLGFESVCIQVQGSYL